MPRPRVDISYNNYGKQRDISAECMIRYSEDSDSIRIFFNNGIKPIYIPKSAAAYNSLKALFELENKEENQ